MEHHRSRLRASRQLKIIQEQAGHEHASTTSIYTCVSSDYRTKTLRQALDKAVAGALAADGGSNR